ncbi:lytic murein transglycosylase [Geothermobacter hydrogeniphilus]|uniref:Lytic murein transglycosylase n=1 Tax=Geothermobacter hydrogeniphilus TaxID=1969733 RepID=A0A2K2HA34_9BACT|nr:lytic murein transglycosylase [Geothermobacter hydrogeniphilus]PNU20175.1 lytic murein transglycosylase [Geothermobacter hydrogeniphilus]
MRLFVHLLLIGSIFALVTPAGATEKNRSFQAWLAELRGEARAAGISQQIIDEALATVRTPRRQVIRLDRNQPEFKQSLKAYVANRINDRRVANGRTMLRRYPTWLGRVERRYGVQRRFILALWGIETGYGEDSGNFPVIRSLATLAYDSRRSGYFRGELIEALRILDAGHVHLPRMKGSWAGAMGQCQFMPSAFRDFAVDADHSGRIDIWGSIPDVLGSIANYLSRSGWKDDQTWGREVKLPNRFDFSIVGLETRLPLSRWQALGVRRSNGRALPRREIEASLIIPNGPKGPAYLVYDNFRVLRRWNRSNAFAVAVGTLADRLSAP